MSVPTDSVTWVEGCLKWRGRVLTGEYRHWCYAWDLLPVDETCDEWPCECAEDLKKGAGMRHEREIYEAAQEYRNWPVADQPGVSLAFERMVSTIWNAAIEEAAVMTEMGGIVRALKRGVR